jgi:hypothetical protein
MTPRFIVDFSRKEVLSIYKHLAASSHLVLHAYWCVLTDSVGEYVSQILHGFLDEQGTLSQVS